MDFILSHHILKAILGVITGAVLGYLYYRFIGCASGTCPITSNKYVASIYGAVLGLFLSL